MTTTTKATSYLREKRACGRISPSTERAMRRVLTDFAALCPQDPSRISRRDVVRWMNTTRHLTPSTRFLYWQRVRGFTSWLVRHGDLRKDPFIDLPAPKQVRTVHRCLNEDQVQALLAACVAPRERVMVLVGLHTGLRRAELAGLQIGDLDLAARTVFVRTGKGGHQRLVPLSTEAARVVGGYVAELGESHGPLIRSEKNPRVGVTPGTVGRIFGDLAYRAGVKVRPRDGVSMHATRHTAATGWYEATGDVLAVRDLLGHANVANTQRYVALRSVERLRSTVEQTRYLPGAA